MADAALFVGFGLPARARERQALQVFAEARDHASMYRALLRPSGSA